MSKDKKSLIMMKRLLILSEALKHGLFPDELRDINLAAVNRSRPAAPESGDKAAGRA